MPIFDKQFSRDMQQGASDLSLILGHGLRYASIGGGFLMMVAGFLAFDGLIIYAASKQSKGQGSNENAFYTGMLWQAMWDRRLYSPMYHRPRHNVIVVNTCGAHPHVSVACQKEPDLETLAAYSAIITVASIVLSVPLGVPEYGAALIAGWLLVATLALLSQGLMELGAWLKPEASAADYEQPSPSFS